jgi:hypothetical protein
MKMGFLSKTIGNLSDNIRQIRVRPIYIPQIMRSETSSISSLFRLNPNQYSDGHTTSIKHFGTCIDLPKPVPLETLRGKAYIELYIKNSKNKCITYNTLGFDNNYKIENGSLDVMLMCMDAENPFLRNRLYWFQIYDTMIVKDILEANHSKKDMADIAPHWHQYIREKDQILESLK